MGSFLSQIFSIFFSSKCLSCGENIRHFGFCQCCWGNLEPRRGHHCRVCDTLIFGPVSNSRCGKCIDKPLPFDRMHGLFDYSGPVGDAIRHGKYGRCPRAIALAAKVCRLAAIDQVKTPKPITLVPIPSHWRRSAQRGFEPTLILAHELSKQLGQPLNKHLLVRKKHTQPQAGMSATQRARNMREAFKATGPSPNTILLVDDVYTTGSTVKSASQTLKRHGAETIHVVTATYVNRS